MDPDLNGCSDNGILLNRDFLLNRSYRKTDSTLFITVERAQVNKFKIFYNISKINQITNKCILCNKLD